MQIFDPDLVIFERFRVDKLLKGTGQSFTYLAHDLTVPKSRPWEREVLLKQYHDVIAGTAEANALYGHFGKLRSKLNEKSNRIVLPLHLGEAGGSMVAAYPYVHGATLDVQVATGMTEEEAVRIAVAITTVVSYLHKREVGIAHLDLKPENVVVRRNPKDNKVYSQLIDLDAARIDGVGIRDGVIGTHGYCSPEHVDRSLGYVGMPSDVFSLGIMLVELLCGKHPFEHAEDYSHAIMVGDFVIPSEDLPSRVVDTLSACLRTHPKERPSAHQLHQTLYANLRFKVDPRRLLVAVESAATTEPVKAAYYERITLGKRHLSGFGLANLPSRLINLGFGPWGASITALDPSTAIEFDGKPLPPGKSVTFLGPKRMKINGIPLTITASEY
jgi:serine/threonine protein kinase